MQKIFLILVLICASLNGTLSKTMITASHDFKIKVWDYETGQIVRTIDAHLLKINALIKLTNESVASCSDDDTVTVWNPFNGILIKNFTSHSAAVILLIQMSNGFLASASSDKNIKIWDPFGSSIVDIPNAHSDVITSIICLNDGNLASGSEDSAIKIWRSSDGQMLKQLPIYSRRVLHIAQVSKKNILAAYDDKFIKIWDKDSNNQIFSVEKNDDMELIQSRFDQYFAYSCGNLIEVRDPSGTLIASMTHPTQVKSIQLLDSNTMISASTNLNTWNFVDNFTDDIPQPASITFTNILPNGYLAAGYENGTVKIWEMSSSSIKAVFYGHTAKIIGIVSSTEIANPDQTTASITTIFSTENEPTSTETVTTTSEKTSTDMTITTTVSTTSIASTKLITSTSATTLASPAVNALSKETKQVYKKYHFTEVQQFINNLKEINAPTACSNYLRCLAKCNQLADCNYVSWFNQIGTFYLRDVLVYSNNFNPNTTFYHKYK